MKQIIYVPTLHSSLAPKGLPEGLFFACPGPSGSDATCAAGLPGAHVPPYKPAEARAILREMLALGAEFGKNGDLKLVAGQGWLEREDARKKESRNEEAALENFANSGTIIKNNPAGESAFKAAGGKDIYAEQLQNAQKALLLAWEHEESIIAMRDIEAKIAESEQSLSAALGDGSEAGKNIFAPPPARPEYSWRVIVDAASAFLPDDAALFTAFGPMIDDLLEAEALKPLPEKAPSEPTDKLDADLPPEPADELAENIAAWPEAIKSSLLAARLPLWRALGYAALPPDRPWLAATRIILAAPRLEQED